MNNTTTQPAAKYEITYQVRSEFKTVIVEANSPEQAQAQFYSASGRGIVTKVVEEWKAARIRGLRAQAALAERMHEISMGRGR